MKKAKVLLLVLLLAAGLAFAVVNRQTAPLAPGKETYVRFSRATSLTAALRELEGMGVVRDAQVAALMARLQRQPGRVKDGTYKVRPGMSLDAVFASLRSPVRQMVRIPEGWWIRRVAERLEKEGVCSAEEYVTLAMDGSQFQGEVEFPLPEGSLEGYLFPDTYDLPPMLGAREVIVRQLRAFEDKAWPAIEGARNPRSVIIKASIIELEAGVDAERPKIAGVIENRLRKGMTLDMDATVLYAMQDWKELGRGVVRTVQSPYNTYLNRGLPPGPIGSPSVASLKAAMDPDSHGYLFYVARPNRTHYFSTTYDQHRAFINKARAEFRQGG